MPVAGLPFLWSGAWPRRRLALGWVAGWVAGWGSFQDLELCSATSRDAGLEPLGWAGRDGTALGSVGELPLFGHISRGHEEVGGVNRRSGTGTGHHFGREHWSLGHHFTPVRAAGAEEPLAGSIWAPRKDGVVDFWPGFLPSGAWPKTGGGGGALGSCGRACWGWSGVTGVTPQVVGGCGLRDRLEHARSQCHRSTYPSGP